MSTRPAALLSVLASVLLVLSAALLAISYRLVDRLPSTGDSVAGGERVAAAPSVPVSTDETDSEGCRVGAWLQQSQNAEAWQDLGVECYVGQYNAITPEVISALNEAGMPFLTEPQEDVRPGDVPSAAEGSVIGWLSPHEPDLSQDGAGGPATPPESVIEAAQGIKTADPTRPVLVFFGAGVAIPQWYGMGSDASRWEEYYKQIVSDPAIDEIAFDYYPWNSGTLSTLSGPIENDPQLVVDGLERLKEWSGGKKVYVTLAASQVNDQFQVPTLEQTSDLVRRLLDAGADGFIWFGHDFSEAGEFLTDAHPLYSDDGSAAMVETVNEQIKRRLNTS